MTNKMKTKKNQVHNRVTNFSLYEEGRDPIESGRTYVKEYDTREDKNSIIDNNLELQKNVEHRRKKWYHYNRTSMRLFVGVITCLNWLVTKKFLLILASSL